MLIKLWLIGDRRMEFADYLKSGHRNLDEDAYTRLNASLLGTAPPDLLYLNSLLTRSLLSTDRSIEREYLIRTALILELNTETWYN